MMSISERELVAHFSKRRNVHAFTRPLSRPLAGPEAENAQGFAILRRTDPGYVCETRARIEGREEDRRAAENRTRCPRAVAVEMVLNQAIDHERSLPTVERMPMPAFDRLQEMSWTVSDCARHGVEVAENVMVEAVAFLREHVRDGEGLMRKVAAAVGA